MDAFRQLIAAEVEAQMATRTQATADLITGLQVALIHIFTIMIAKGVLSREAAIASIEDTIRLNQPHLPPAAEVVLTHILQGIGMQEEGAPNVAPIFRLIQGGRDGEPPKDP